MRIDGRLPDQLRPVNIIPDYIMFPEGSVLISVGNTRVLCNTTIEDTVPRWLQDQGIVGGWLTAEYSLLPRSTHTRTPRETHGLGGRTQEIRRLIGRSLRASLDLKKLGQRTITIDCDVLQADGGTRTAAITGGYVSMVLAAGKLIKAGAVPPDILLSPVAAVSAGIVSGVPLLDLNYAEDSKAEVDVNIVMNGRGDFIEIQGTAEGNPFSRRSLDALLELAAGGIRQLIEVQQSVLP